MTRAAERSYPTGVVLLVLLACIFALPAGTTAGVANPTSQQIAKLKKKALKKTANAVKKSLRADPASGLAEPGAPPKIKVPSCKQRRAKGKFAGFKCAWSAKGELPGRVPFRCDGKAKVDAKAKVKKIDKCRNEEKQLLSPLLANPHPVNFGYSDTFDVNTDLWDELQTSGADTALQGVAWDSLQPSQGSAPSTWNWGVFDSIYNQALAAGTRPVWNFIDAPCWAAAGGSCDNAAVNPPAAAHIGDYATAAAEIAKRYPQSRAVEVWLEPNGPFWGTTPDPARFSALVGAAADAVHATGTGVAVFAGGLAPGSASPDKQEFGSFLSDALAVPGIECADAIGFHAVTNVPFASGSDPTGGYLGKLREQLQTLRSQLDAAGATMPISITQLSYTTNGPDAYTEAQQAEALVSSLDVLQRTADISVVVVEHLLDTGDGSKVQGFGVLRSDRSKKPAYCQLAAARGVATPPGC